MLWDPLRVLFTPYLSPIPLEGDTGVACATRAGQGGPRVTAVPEGAARDGDRMGEEKGSCRWDILHVAVKLSTRSTYHPPCASQALANECFCASLAAGDGQGAGEHCPQPFPLLPANEIAGKSLSLQLTSPCPPCWGISSTNPSSSSPRGHCHSSRLQARAASPWHWAWRGLQRDPRPSCPPGREEQPPREMQATFGSAEPSPSLMWGLLLCRLQRKWRMYRRCL